MSKSQAISETISQAMGLEGLRVIEISVGLAAAMAGKLMAELGATVLKIEPPGGDPMRHWGPFPKGTTDPARGEAVEIDLEAGGLFAAMHPGKRSLVLDLETEAGHQRLAELAAEVDILLHDLPPNNREGWGLSYDRLSANNEPLVMLSMSTFGDTGPHAQYAGADLVTVHGGGWGWLAPTGSQQPELPPLAPFGQQGAVMAALHGAVAAMGAHVGAVRRGLGEYIDLSAQAVVAAMLEQNLMRWGYEGLVTSRLGAHMFGPWGFYPCADGQIFIITAEEDQWQRMVELMGHPEWAELEVFADIYLRAENADFLDRLIGEWTASWNVRDLFHTCQQQRICAAPVYTPVQLETEKHLRERGFFVKHQHPRLGQLTLPGAPWKLKQPWWELRGPAPQLNEAGKQGEQEQESPARQIFPPRPELPAPRQRSAASVAETPPAATADGARGDLPLEGIRVLDLSWVWAGPYCALQLAHLGAEVIKVESALRPDLARRVRIYPEGMEPGLNRSGYFNQYGQGKKSVTVNLSRPEGVELVKRLSQHCDVVLDNFATGVMERLGLSPAVFHEMNPDLIIASISGYGQTGPMQNYMGYGPAIVPLSGLTAVTGYADGLPREVGISYGDPNGGIFTAFAIVAALAARERGGSQDGGQVIELSLWEAQICAAIEAWVGHALGADYRPMGNRSPRWAPHNVYRCAGEEAWVAIAVTSEEQWHSLCQALDRPELATDKRFGNLAARKAHEDALDELITAWTESRDRWEITHTLQAAGVPAFPSLSNRDLTEDPHLNARGFFSQFDHAEVGVRLHAGIPWRLRHGPNGVRSPAPLLGAHTEEVLSQLLGLSTADITRLREEQVLA